MMSKIGQGEKHPIKSYVNRRIRKRHLKHILCLLIPILLAVSTVFLISFAGIEVTPEGELLLFKADEPTLEGDLNAGVVSEGLKIIFEKKGFPLSENAALVNSSDTEYVITNEEKNVISTESTVIAKNRSYLSSKNGAINNKTTKESIIKKEEKDVVAEESKKIVTTKSPLQSGNFTSTSITRGWVIASAGKVYTIRKADEELKIYGKVITLRYIIAAFILIYVIILSSKLLYAPINYKFTNMEIDKRIAFNKVKESIIIATLASVIIYIIEILIVRILPTLHGYSLLFQL